MADRTYDTGKEKFNNIAEFAQNLENYLKDLQFADYVKINCDEKNYVIEKGVYHLSWKTRY